MVAAGVFADARDRNDGPLRFPNRSRGLPSRLPPMWRRSCRRSPPMRTSSRPATGWGARRGRRCPGSVSTSSRCPWRSSPTPPSDTRRLPSVNGISPTRATATRSIRSAPDSIISPAPRSGGSRVISLSRSRSTARRPKDRRFTRRRTRSTRQSTGCREGTTTVPGSCGCHSTIRIRPTICRPSNCCTATRRIWTRKPSPIIRTRTSRPSWRHWIRKSAGCSVR